jgi:hypothetical protein
MIGFIDISFTIRVSYKSSQSMAANDSLHSLLDCYEFLLFLCDWLGSDLRIGHLRITKDEWTQLNSRVESYVTTDDQPAGVSWNKAPIWGLRPDFYYCQTVAGLLM